jgi:hypothetical protein
MVQEVQALGEPPVVRVEPVVGDVRQIDGAGQGEQPEEGDQQLARRDDRPPGIPRAQDPVARLAWLTRRSSRRARTRLLFVRGYCG